MIAAANTATDTAVWASATPAVTTAGPHEKRLLHALLDNYNSLERPVVNESDPLQLSFGLTLMQIIDVAIDVVEIP
uniref:Neurotransmitter-gated ion-channel ligand-binding domain-containing protein n=1 Tax=Glossina morsitans morsitans TaxID=37546 RepID=A0A1B0FEV4_GLOMM